MLHKETTSDIENVTLLNLKRTEVKSLFDETHARENRKKNTKMLYSIICVPVRFQFHQIVTHSKEEVYLTMAKHINCCRAQKE
jgi:hypothetical protein